jgi:Holliday junction DNA helicase RuvA
MISYLQGTLVQRTPTELVIDVSGVGYSVSIPLSTFEKLGHVGEKIKILTYMHVREDIIQLYGFAAEAEREMFRLLISISGIGPKMAQGILSGLSTAELRAAIVEGNLSALTSIPGVGRKTAERLVIELRDKLSKVGNLELSPVPSSNQLKSRSEAVVALMALGHSRASAEKAVFTVLKESTQKEIPVEELIRRALRHASQ